MELFTPLQLDAWRSALRHVYWIGGPPDAGKSTVTDLLAEKCGLLAYRQDRHEREHLERADPDQHPANARLAATLNEPDFLEWLWLSSPPAVMANWVRATWSERITLICEDLALLPTAPPIIAEGPGFFPDVICPLLADPWHAIWLLPTPAFKRGSHERRGKSAWRLHTSNPGQALANHLERDLLLIEMYHQQLERHRLAYIEIDGTIPPPAVAERIIQHLKLAPRNEGGNLCLSRSQLLNDSRHHLEEIADDAE